MNVLFRFSTRMSYTELRHNWLVRGLLVYWPFLKQTEGDQEVAMNIPCCGNMCDLHFIIRSAWYGTFRWSVVYQTDNIGYIRGARTFPCPPRSILPLEVFFGIRLALYYNGGRDPLLTQRGSTELWLFRRFTYMLVWRITILGNSVVMKSPTKTNLTAASAVRVRCSASFWLGVAVAFKQ